MANIKHALSKCMLCYPTFSFGNYVRLRHFYLTRGLRNSRVQLKTLQSRRNLVTSAVWSSRQTNYLIDGEVKNKTQGKGKQIVNKKTEQDRHPEESIPLIVKLMNPKKEPVILKDNHDQTLTIQELQKTLEYIKWDTDARKHRLNVEGMKEIEEEIENVESHQNDSDGTLKEMTTIEDIYLDYEVPQIRTVQKEGKKHKIKGTPDPNIPASDVPCSGCGAHLHCQDPVIPGYMPSEKFRCLTRDDMRTSMCQRCFLIQTYNMFLNVRVSAETYPHIIQEIKKTKALVIVVIDLFDMKNSVYENLLEHIGTHRPLFIVGNKFDLLPRDSKGCIERTKQTLLDVCSAAGLNPTGKNIKHVCLVSAKTGYGIESLVTKLMTVWKLQGHVYVVGSTNVGKSTLFNALLMSDYCKAVARGFINRATVSVWPGTTLNLLKFPIVNPAPWRLALRFKRLAKDEKEYAAAEELRRSRLQELGSYKADLLTGHIGLTDFRSARTIAEEAEVAHESSGQDLVSFSCSKDGSFQEGSGPEALKDDVKSHCYRPESYKMYWCNDTPGVVNPEQIINLLEPEELVAVLPRTRVQPQCVVISPGQVLFVTGMGRVDYVQGNTSVYLTVYVAHSIKLHVKDHSEADQFYAANLGTDTFGVPLGSEDRLSRIPALVGREFHITGTQWSEAAADIQLSSLGWVSVAAGAGMAVTLRAYTPGGRGLHLRSPALLPNYTCFKGKRKGKTPFFRPAHLTL